MAFRDRTRRAISLRHQEEAASQLSWQPELADDADAFRARTRARHAWLKIGVLAGVALVAVQPRSVRSFWRRNAALRAAPQADFDPVAGISVTGLSSGMYPWSSVHSVLETERVFVVRLSGYGRLAFCILAKRGLPTTGNVAELRGEWARDIAVVDLVGVPAGRWGIGGKPAATPAPSVTFGIREAAFGRPDAREIVARLVADLTDAIVSVFGERVRSGVTVELVGTPDGRTGVAGQVASRRAV